MPYSLNKNMDLDIPISFSDPNLKPFKLDPLFINGTYNTTKKCTVCRGARFVYIRDRIMSSGIKKYCLNCKGTGEMFVKGNEKEREVLTAK